MIRLTPTNLELLLSSNSENMKMKWNLEVEILEQSLRTVHDYG